MLAKGTLKERHIIVIRVIVVLKRTVNSGLLINQYSTVLNLEFSVRKTDETNGNSV